MRTLGRDAYEYRSLCLGSVSKLSTTEISLAIIAVAAISGLKAIPMLWRVPMAIWDEG